MLISTGGTVIKMPVEDVKRLGRSTQGVIVMRLREGETVSSLAPVIDDAEDDATVTDEPDGPAAADGGDRPTLDGGEVLEPFEEESEEDVLDDEPSTE